MTTVTHRSCAGFMATTALVVSSIATGQTMTDINTLPSIDRYNETQFSLAGAILSLVEGPYNGFNSSAQFSSAQEEEMVNICRTYNSQLWAMNPADVDQLIENVDLIAHEEVGAAGSGLTDTSQNQVGTIIGRLQELRGVSPALASNSLMRFSGGAAGDDFSKLSYFANVNYGDGSKDKTSREQGFDFDSLGVTTGVDYRFTDTLIAGAALSFSQSEADIDNNLGSSETDSITLTLYTSYYFDKFYVDGVLGFGQHDYDNQRNLLLASSGLAPSDQFIGSSTDGDSLHISVGGGYSHQLKQWKALEAWTGTYSARLDYTDASIDGYTEDQSNSLALQIGKQDVESLQLVLGSQFTRSFSKSWGVLNPYFGLEFHQEFEDETRVVTAQYAYDRFGNSFSFTSDDADSSYFLVSIGSSFGLAQGMQLFVNLDHVVGLDDVDSNSLTAGMRFEL